MSYASIIKAYKARQRKTFSQKVALFFAYINLPLVILSTITIAITMLPYVGYDFMTFIFGYYSVTPIFGVILFISILEIVMLIGYIKHARGNLSEHMVWGLWLCKIFFSLSALVIIRWFIISEWFETKFLASFWDVNFWQRIDTFLFAIGMLWLVISCSLALLSLYSDELNYRKTRSNGNAP